MERIDSAEIRAEFGKVFKIWFSRNNWPQDVPHKVSNFILTGGPWNSQISTCMSGKLDPKVGFFLACGEFNRVIAEQKFPGVTDTRLLSMIQGATPLIGDNKQIFIAADFFSLYTGQIPVPLDYQLPILPPLNDLEAKAICEQMRASFHEIARDNMLAPMDAWESLELGIGGMLEAEKRRFKDVLSGWADYKAEELSAMPSNDPRSAYKPAMALVNWSIQLKSLISEKQVL